MKTSGSLSLIYYDTSRIFLSTSGFWLSRINNENKAIVDIRFHPRFDAAPWWVSAGIRCGVKSVLFHGEPF